MDAIQDQTDMSHHQHVYNTRNKKKQKLAEQLSTEVQKLQGQSASTSNELRTRYLIRQLPLFVKEESLRRRFGAFGQVLDISFVHRQDRNYTLSCVVEIVLHDHAAGQRLVETPHKFGLLRVTAELFTGNEHIVETGNHALEIHNVFFDGSDNNTNGEMIYKSLEALFHRHSYSEMELKKSDKYTYTGEVVIFFHTATGRRDTINWIRAHRRSWVIHGELRRRN